MNKKLSWWEAIRHCKYSAESWVLATVIGTRGSTPRDSGSKMVITADATYDTVGGGQLEFDLIDRARQMLRKGQQTQTLAHIPLAARAKQCCGGDMAVLLECFPASRLAIHIFGAGHVARALVGILGQLDAQVTWVDSRAGEFPQELPHNTKKICRPAIVEHVADMAPGAYAIVLTHQHSLDYELLAALLDRKDCTYIGVIGSQTKALRFRQRLTSDSFSQAEIDSVHCPIGSNDICGKLPMEVAVSIAAQVIQLSQQRNSGKKMTGLAWQEINRAINDERAPRLTDG